MKTIVSQVTPIWKMIGALVVLVTLTLILTYSLSSQHIYRRVFSQQSVHDHPHSFMHSLGSVLNVSKVSLSPNRSLVAVDPAHIQSLLRSYQSEVLYSSHGNLLQVENKLYKVELKKKRVVLREFNSCAVSSMLDLFEAAQNPILPTTELFPDFSSSIDLLLSVDPVVKSGSLKTESQILIVYTTCNQLSMTILSLQFLRNTDKLADLIIVDDHSTDGTVEYLRKRGFAVITKPKATGLTDSWNIGYRLAVALGYKNVVFTNNDVLLTTGSVALMHQGLRDYALVVPLTTEKGAGHHPAQSIMRAYKLPQSMMSYTHDYRHAEFIQETILKKFILVSPEQRRCPAQYSKSKGLPKFNGFCFSVNVDKIAPAAYEENVHLFDPGDVIVGQEDHLVQRMHEHKLMPIILHCSFVYHFKSVTVSSANFTAFVELMRAHRVYVKQLGKSPVAQISFRPPGVNQSMVTRRVDIREDLRWYHPEEQEDFVAELLNLTRATKENRNTLRQGLICAAPTEHGVLFPLASPVVSTRLQHLYQNFAAMSWNIRSNTPCVYPFQWAPHCEQLLGGGSSFEPELYAVSTSNFVVIAIAMSDPIASPSAGDVFTAYELGDALMMQFSHVRVRYLARGPQWYSPELLHDVDVLITLLDDYDLLKTLSLFQDHTPPSYPQQNEYQCNGELQIKPNLITIAWARNWFHRWLTKPWIGNYDLIFTSSSLTKSFYDTIAEEHGLAVSCAISCPRLSVSFQQRSVADKYLSPQVEKRTNSTTRQDNWNLFPSRAKVSVHVFPIATAVTPAQNNANIVRGSRNGEERPLPSHSQIAQYNPKNGLSLSAETRRLFEGVDYLFSGSYFNVHRRVMDFDPDVVPEFSGRIVGKNWKKANVTKGWLSICTGLLPYEIVKESYQYVKIVIDDANHVTAPWGSVNSRVFDALAAGALVVSNGAIGLTELFGLALQDASLPLPLYTTGQDLATQLQFYLTHDEIRVKTAAIMREVVLREHTYSRRAEQLVELLQSQFSMKFLRRSDAQRERFKEKQRKKSGRVLRFERDNEIVENREILAEIDRRFEQVLSDTPTHRVLSIPSHKMSDGETIGTNQHSLCVGVRTAQNQGDWLPVLLHSLIVQHRNSVYRNDIALQIYLVDTEAHTEYTRTLMELADQINGKFSESYVHVMVGSRTVNKQERDALGGKVHANKVYGYDDTDRLLTHFIDRFECPRAYSSVRSSLSDSSCEWIMFTNGDNMYNSAWFDTIAPFIVATTNVQDSNSSVPLNATLNITRDAYDIIGWDFITHHPRGAKNDTPNQPIHIMLERRHVDLGSVLFRSSLFVQSNTRFLQDASLTMDLFARDFFTIKRILPHTRPDRIMLIHQCLLLHQ